MYIIQNPIAPALEELAALLEQLSFSDRNADLRSGTHWSVYVHPWLHDEDDDRFDALVTATPLTGLPPETCAGAGLILASGNVLHRAARPMNERGQIWFRDLPVGEFRTHSSVLPAVRPDAGRMTAAPAQPDSPQEAMNFEEICNRWEMIGAQGAEREAKRLLAYLTSPAEHGLLAACRIWAQGGPGPDDSPRRSELIDSLLKNLDEPRRRIAEAQIECARLARTVGAGDASAAQTTRASGIERIGRRTGAPCGLLLDLLRELSPTHHPGPPSTP